MVVCFLNFLVVSDFMIIMVEITALNQFRSNQRKAILGVFFYFLFLPKRQLKILCVPLLSR